MITSKIFRYIKRKSSNLMDRIYFIRMCKKIYKYNSNAGVDLACTELKNQIFVNYKRIKILEYYKNNPKRIYYEKELFGLTSELPYLMTSCVDDYRKHVKNIESELSSIQKDENGLFFIIRNNKKMYFKRSMDNISDIIKYYSYLSYEQSDGSAHQYTSKNFSVDKDDIIADCGAAEGIFALDNIANAKEVYLFEYDDEWIEALNYTFANFGEKVHIVKKYVSNVDNEYEIKLDTYFKNNRVDFIKMDIEGAEVKVIGGMNKLLCSESKLKLAIAAYHNPTDEYDIKDKLGNFDILPVNGYLMHGWEVSQPPFFRVGIIKAIKR